MQQQRKRNVQKNVLHNQTFLVAVAVKNYATVFYFFDGVSYKYINESFAFSPGCMWKELLMHFVNKNEDFQGPLMS